MIRNLDEYRAHLEDYGNPMRMVEYSYVHREYVGLPTPSHSNRSHPLLKLAYMFLLLCSSLRVASDLCRRQTKTVQG